MDQYIKSYRQFLAKRAVETSIFLLILGLIMGWLASSVFSETECPIEVEAGLISEGLGEDESLVDEGINQVSIIEPSEYQVEGSDEVQRGEKCVDVSGAVVKPGVYCLRGESILIEAVEKAGGFRVGEYAGRYVAQTLNLAKATTDGMKVYVPYQEEVSCTIKALKYEEVDLGKAGDGSEESEGEGTDPAATCVNINTSSKDELMTLDGVGEVSADSIIENRPYESNEDLLEVSGIGQAKLDAMKPKLCDL